MRSSAKAVAASALLAFASGAGAAERYQQTGLASWYGAELAGARTASGARFDPAGLSAAHRSLPLGSFVEVTALDSGRSVLVLVNDRGPHRRDRLIDLSHGAAKALGMNGRSFTRVRLRAVERGDLDAVRRSSTPTVALVASDNRAMVRPATPALDPRRRYLLQVATFSSATRAQALARAVDGAAMASHGLWRVQIGPMKAGEVQRARDAVAERGYGDARILPAVAMTEDR
ncbi:rare lipoprotein A [Sphingomonas jinjuensis]|uniref:Endolytic peptidoglycan transglycosylase RlpA n=1 Tax=Sphingomonas jinjuensis TaxID=535907 RepID=A0A840F8J4_9SPHN|nr:septal ring lytic transglycosylase RlpA family protein [Sphingomonas jinjuensis]MBB4154039.1 rare lipoprotein A [Sphingomonas jinjuensis]